MRSFKIGLIPVCGFILSGVLAAAPAQQNSGANPSKSSDSKNGPRLTLADSDGSPGNTAVVPIYFEPAEGIEVGELKFNVQFVSRNLKYSKITRGIAAESGNVDVHADLKETKNDKGLEISTLTVVASMPSPKPGQKGIPPGLLGYITFNINATAGPANITLHATGEAAELGTKKPIPNLRTVDAQFDVLANGSEPLVSCFFFSH